MSQQVLLPFGSFFIDFNVVVLTMLVAIAAGFDVRLRRIPNWLVLTGMVSSLSIQMLSGGANFSTWGFGLLVGFGLFLPLYMVRAMGAGDVKLMAMVGSFVGPLSAFAVVLTTLVAGGILATAAAIGNGALRRTLENVRFVMTHTMIKTSNGDGPQLEELPASTGNLPYAVAITAGTVIHLLLERSGLSLFS
jgi:prepilin peptidase CpaA